MAKSKASGKSYTSAGVHSNVANATLRAMRASTASDKVFNQLEAFRKGKRVMVTIPNPDTTMRDKPFIRVSADTIWKNRANEKYCMTSAM